MELFLEQRLQITGHVPRHMGRLVIHTHGVPKEKAYKRLLDMYAERLQSRGVRVECHPSKLSPEDYVNRLFETGGSLMLLDEAGLVEDSLAFAQRFEGWQLTNHTTHLAIGPAEGWPSLEGLRSVPRLSLSPMTFPHELAAVVLVEQVYRASEVLRGSGYHKA